MMMMMWIDRSIDGSTLTLPLFACGLGGLVLLIMYYLAVWLITHHIHDVSESFPWFDDEEGEGRRRHQLFEWYSSFVSDTIPS